MQIIQSIRDKGAAVVIAVIALSLIGFILMDAKQGGSRLFGGLSNNAGNINGTTIDVNYFNDKVKQAEDQEEQRSGQKPSGTRLYQLRDQVWDQIVAEKIFTAEAKKLGLDLFTSEELSAILLSNDQSNPLLQESSLIDPATGKLDMAKAQEAVNNMKRATGAQAEMIKAQVIQPLSLNNKVSKYSALMSSSAYYPAWMKQKDTESSKQFSSFSFVSIPFSEIPDSTIKVTDDEINAYVKKNEELYKQEAGRVVSYYSFSQQAVGEDSAATLKVAQELKPLFEADTNNSSFVVRNASTIEFRDKFIPKSQISSTFTDSIISRPAGTVYGPYLENGSYVLAKYLGSKSIPDSVQARHILIVTTDRNSGKMVRDDSAAKKLADSLLNAVNTGSNFGLLAMQFSADGSKDKGGDLGTFGFGAMVPEFNDFCFYKSQGEKGVVKTQFGYHVIEITSQKNFNQAYKIAFVAKEILASDVTINNASLSATKAAAMKDAKSLAEYASKNKLQVVTNPTVIKANDYMVGALQDARQLVRWAFEANKGDVSEPMNINDQFIVATLDKVVEEGLQDAETARPGAEPMVKKEKKAEMIIKKLGSNSTLQAAAAAYNKQVMEAGADSSVTFANPFIANVGMENTVVGAAFCKKFMNTPTPPFAGNTGVFVLKVNNIGSKPADSPEAAMQAANQKLSSLRGQTNGWYEGLKKLADIKDNRSSLY